MENTELTKSHEDLICGYLKGELTPRETAELINWIKTDKANKRYFDECSELWITAKSTSGNPDFNAQEGFWKFKQKIKESDNPEAKFGKTLWLRTIARYAAVVIIAFSLGGLLFYHTGKKSSALAVQSINQLSVPLGSRAQFTLSDGTVVTLNAGSLLKIDNRFGINDRIIQLDGEGYFNVARDSKKPFIVQTPYLNVTALGTEFNVKAYSIDKTIETTLVNGSIIIEPITETNKGQTTILKPNQKLIFYKEDSGIEEESKARQEKVRDNINPVKVNNEAFSTILVKEDVNVEPIVSWKGDRWIFEQQSLSQIAVDLERRFDVQIVFDSDQLKSYRFTGTILAEPIEQVLEVMSITAPISFKLKGKVVTLSENKDFIEINKSLYTQP